MKIESKVNIEHRTPNIEGRRAGGLFSASAASPGVDEVACIRRLGKSRERCAPTRLRGRGALTLAELLVVLASVAALVLFALLVRPGPARGDWRLKCGMNLRQIGQAMRQYAIDNNGNYPRTLHDPDRPTPRFFTGVDAPDPFGSGGPAANDVTAVGWLLLREYAELPVEVFTCPSTAHTPFDISAFGKRNKRDMSNFPDARFLSYSFTNPYPSRALADAGWDWTDQRTSTFVLAGDVNPGSRDLFAQNAIMFDRRAMSAINSPNHGGEGQSLLFADGSVRFTTTPFEGAERDNVYTAGGPPAPPPNPPKADVAIVSPPLTPEDTVLLPVATSEQLRPPAEVAKLFWLRIVLPGLALGGLILGTLIILANRARRRKLERGELPDMPPS